MAKKKVQSSEILDFETGETVSDETLEWAAYQKKLFTIDNPYVGNKRKLVVDIANALRDNGIKYDSVADLFSGSGVVSLFMKMIGKDVYSNDLLTSSFFNALVFVENNREDLTSADVDFLCKNNNPGKGEFVQVNYAERFTPVEAQFLDNYRANIETLDQNARFKWFEDNCDGKPEWMERQAAYCRQRDIFKASAYLLMQHYILSRCFIGGRLNNGQVLAQLEHRMGHQRNAGDPAKNLLNEDLGKLSFDLGKLPVFDFKGIHRAYNMDAEAFLLNAPLPEVDLLYIDPPYGGQQSDYAHMFAFNEEYVYGKKLDELPHIANASKFSSKKDYESHFSRLLSRAGRFPCWAISYNDSSWANVDKIVEVVNQFRQDVKVVEIDYKYKYRGEQADGVEYVIIAQL